MTATVLKFEDVQPFVPSLDEIESDFARNYAKDRILKNYQNYVKQINNNYNDLICVWPEAQPINLFFGLIDSADIAQLKENLANNYQYKEKILAETEKKLQEIGRLDNSSSNSTLLFQEDQQIDDIISGWAPETREKFISLYTDFWNDVSNEEFARKVGYSVDICKKLVERLSKDGELNKEKPKKIDKKESKYVKISPITGITFIRNGKKYRIGKGLTDPNDNPLNPLHGVPDPLTEKEMCFPMICPQFYVLDRSTWAKSISEKHEHPYLRTHMGTKRDLIPLTIDNFNEYKDKIRNIDLEKYGLK
ncbi:hypothetical protein TVAG_493780 [Trichomonas vaginalis G3]|uniref:Uncharacterized protein n=1 Tax=Trichomonas vaginalis (strain ATCC PRA-98 / G3) TaxID=412133 RepID=A2DQ09_TRIV3|nr:hypothetical protein TVAGG3_0384530 [Trichomonas vaginalis G3]EAY17436.1 hypothetical protein TVAG_493780 [Trichomonas vaginalis G3]KAI5533531.1 hypothetical protein TVAGG3_0384530 [Trichomonas vaginalis G3]|eukprot:XP_001329571.1 hypothetical protein [Trichomonas vaginalis G3]